MWRTSSVRRKSLPSTMRLPGPRLMGLRGAVMELFTKLCGGLVVCVYHCFDRIVIHGYLSGLSRPEQVFYFFRQVLGVPVVSKEVLSQRTTDYQAWVEAFARNHDVATEWAEKGVRKEDYVQPWLRKMVRRNAYGVYFIFKSMERGRAIVSQCRSSRPLIPTTASWPARRAGSPTTISTSAMKCSVPWSCVWRRSFPSRRRITSTATTSSSKSSIARRSPFVRTTTRSSPLMMLAPCRGPPTN